MNVVVNGRFMARRTTGVERYGKEILPHLFHQMPGRLRVVPPPVQSQGWRGHLWEQVILPGYLRPGEILWSPANTGPVWTGNQALTLHDITPLEHPDWFTPAFAGWYQLFLPLLVRRARIIIVPSLHVQRKVIARFGLAARRIKVVPGGVDLEIFRPSVARPFELPDSYVLFVGSIQPGKNLARLLQAWQMVMDTVPDTWLLIAGAGGKVFHIPDLPEAPQVSYLGYIPDASLPGLYANATLFVLPSLDEGLGLPILEAMACGAPVAAANAGALPEVMGGSGLLFDPLDVASISSTLQRGLVDAALRNTLRAFGFARVQQFSWQASAEMMWRLFKECQ